MDNNEKVFIRYINYSCYMIKKLLIEYMNFLSDKEISESMKALIEKENGTLDFSNQDSLYKINKYISYALLSYLNNLDKYMKKIIIYFKDKNSSHISIQNGYKDHYFQNIQSNTKVNKIFNEIYNHLFNINQELLIRIINVSDSENLEQNIDTNKKIESFYMNESKEKSLNDIIKNYIKTYYNGSKLEVTHTEKNIPKENTSIKSMNTFEFSYPNMTIVVNNYVLNKKNNNYKMKSSLSWKHTFNTNLLLSKKLEYFLDKSMKAFTKNSNDNEYNGEKFTYKILPKLIHLIVGYENLFSNKCSICKKSVKYSINDKCFYPAYYQIYNEKQFNVKDHNGKRDFYHEECFKKEMNNSIQINNNN